MNEIPPISGYGLHVVKIMPVGIIYCRTWWEKLCTDKLACIIPSLPTSSNENFSCATFLSRALMCPLIASLIWFTGETVPEIIARLRRDLIPTIKSGLIYWPLCDFITFKFIPVHLQVTSRSWHILPIWAEKLFDSSLNWWLVFSAASKQFLLVSMDHLHNIHGRLEETRSKGDHKLVVIFERLHFDEFLPVILKGSLHGHYLEWWWGCQYH